MEADRRPFYYYLVKCGETIKIERVTDTEMSARHDESTCWIGMGFKTLAEAEAALKAHRSG
jgi:hypothetical protein